MGKEYVISSIRHTYADVHKDMETRILCHYVITESILANYTLAQLKCIFPIIVSP